MARNIVQFELRKVKDDDIAKALEKMVTVEQSRSSIIREALRNYFSGNRTQRRIVEESVEGVVLQVAEKDDAQLDDALNNLLNF